MSKFYITKRDEDGTSYLAISSIVNWSFSSWNSDLIMPDWYGSGTTYFETRALAERVATDLRAYARSNGWDCRITVHNVMPLSAKPWKRWTFKWKVRGGDMYEQDWLGRNIYEAKARWLLFWGHRNLEKMERIYRGMC